MQDAATAARYMRAQLDLACFDVAGGLARAMRLSDAERDHLHHLAGGPPGLPPLVTQHMDVRH